MEASFIGGGSWSMTVLVILFSPFGFLASKDLIICLSTIMALSVLDEGYSRNTLCALDVISTFLFK